MKKIRIFISSPGDVQQERQIARRVIDELNKRYADYAQLEVLMWEDFPLSPTATFQEGIDTIVKNGVIDIAVFILWSRLGSPLNNTFKKKDGTYYQSGTEYEYETMLALNRQSESGNPHILVYVKNADIKEAIKEKDFTLEQLQESLQQNKNLQAFIREHFHDAETDSNYAYLTFEKPVTFEQRLRTHLSSLIVQIIGHVESLREWEGNPYVGLNAYDYHQSEIFFGRRNLVYDIAGQLFGFSEKETKRGLILIGESGSGKSSLIHAGLLPFVLQSAQSGFERVFVAMLPSVYGDKIYGGIIDCLVQHFPSLQSDPVMDELRQGIEEGYNFKHLVYSLARANEKKELILFIDQFEELFTSPQLSEATRKATILLLRGLSESLQIRIFLTIRSDFYHLFLQNADLGYLKEHCLVVDIPSVGIMEMTEIVEEPARKACLKWEINQQGYGLNKQVVQDAEQLHNLPMIEFALSELYQQKNSHDELTFEAYRKIGGLKGAVIHYADTFYQGLTGEEKLAFEELLGFVVSESSSVAHVCVRKTSLRRDMEQSEVHRRVLKKLIDAHLFVAGKNSDNEATVTLIHEVLIQSWPVVSDWIRSQQEFLKKNAYYEQRAQYYKASGCLSKELVQERSGLLEAEYQLFKYEKVSSEDVNNFLKQSIRKSRRKGLVWQSIFACLFLISISCLFACKWTGLNFDEDLNEWLGFNQMSLWKIVFIYFPFLLLFAHSLTLKIIALPKYRTIKYSVYFWLAIFVYLSISCLYDGDVETGVPLLLMMGFPLLSVLVPTVWEWRRRLKWQKKGFSPFAIKDDIINKVRTVAATILIGFMIIFASVAYVDTLETKNNLNDRLLNIADQLFSGLNNIQSSLSPTDFIYVNELRKSYLREGFGEELNDTICDLREFQYATCLYNLQEPQLAKAYLYPTEDSTHLLLYILCFLRMGDYSNVETCMDLYIQANCFDNLSWTSTADLIWIAEKIGRFDWAEKLFEVIEENEPTLLNNPACSINRGHIYLSKNRINEAAVLYRQARNQNIEWNGSGKMIDEAIQRDFHTFSRFGSMDGRLLEAMSQKMSLTYQSAYTPANADSVLNKSIFKRLEGTWKCDLDSLRYLNMEVVVDKDHQCQFNRYHVFFKQSEGWKEVNRFLSNVRFCGKEGRLLWDEYNLIDDNNYLGEIISLTDDELKLRILDNGVEEQRGTERLFKRIVDAEKEK